jgi:hypothetical protein
MKKIAVLGTGMVGATIGAKLISLGYQVMMGSRSADNEKGLAWVTNNGPSASLGSFEDATKFGEVIFNCTKGEMALTIIKSIDENNFKNKTFIDISNPLDFSKGRPPVLVPELTNTNSLAEEIQRLLPDARVVKTLNIVNCEIMVNPKKSGGDPTMFVCGNNADAKAETIDVLHQFGWLDIIDLGDISTARGMEMMLPIWLRTYMATGNSFIAFKVIR